jgi:hypothetical protein
LYGWSAAERLEGADSGNPDHPLVQEAFKLLRYRFSLKQIGEMTAFTLNYLNGAAQNASILSIAQGQAPINPPNLDDLLQIVGQNQSIDAAKKFLVDFENILTAEFYALSQNGDDDFQNEKASLLTKYFNFIEGFHEGIAEAADVHYQETLNLAFGIGYTWGFRDGYALGYTSGYYDGFAAGNAAAWAAANKIIVSLQDQISNLQAQLGQAQSAQGGGGSGSGFWDALGNIDSAVDTAIGVIGLFS